MKLWSLVILLVGCNLTDDVVKQCQSIVDAERVKIEMDINQQVQSDLQKFIDDTFTSYGCSKTDGGLWNCSLTVLCAR